MNSGHTHFAAKPQTFKLPILRRGFPLFIVCILRSLSGRTAPGAPQGFLGSGENGYLFSGSWVPGALIIILGELGSKLIILRI